MTRRHPIPAEPALEGLLWEQEQLLARFEAELESLRPRPQADLAEQLDRIEARLEALQAPANPLPQPASQPARRIAPPERAPAPDAALRRVRTEAYRRQGARLVQTGGAALRQLWDAVPHDAEIARPLFDAALYLRLYPDVAAHGMDPFQHFMEHGWAEQRQFNRLFSVADYLAAHPIVAASGINPVLYHCHAGWREGVGPSSLFDAAFYVRRYPDIQDQDPFAHFITHGALEGRLPTASFDPAGFAPPADPTDRWSAVQAYADGVEHFAASLDRLWFDTAGEAEISVIVYAADQFSAAYACLRALGQGRFAGRMEVIVIDDASHDLLPLGARRWQGVRVLRHERRIGWAAAMQDAAAHVTAPLVLLLSAEVELAPDAVPELLATMRSHPGVGMAGPRVLNTYGELVSAGLDRGSDGALAAAGLGQSPRHPAYRHARDVGAPDPACVLVRAEHLDMLTDAGPPLDAIAGLATRIRGRGQAVRYQGLAEAVLFGAGPEREGIPADRAAPVPWLRSARPRILVVEHVTPQPDRDAGSVVTYRYMEILLELGFAVTFVAVLEPGGVPGASEALERMGVECIRAPVYGNLWELAKERAGTYDALLLFRAPAAAEYLRVLKPFFPEARVILQTIDLHFLRERRLAVHNATGPASLAAAEATRLVELDAIRQADCTIVVSEFERSVLATEAPDAWVEVIPLVIDAQGRQADFAETRDIGFIGSFKHEPNRDAVCFFVARIWPLLRPRLPPGTQFRIMGSDVVPEVLSLRGNGVVIDGFVPDLATSLARCRVSVAPLRTGAGIKGKVASSLSYGIPCVATGVAVEGMGLGPEEGVLVADDPAAYAEAVLRLYTDPAAWHRLSEAGLAFVERRLSSQTVRGQIEALLRKAGVTFP